ncbi:MAG TPA: AbrB/MazE/SpoVT family DNA-binding domain-containing protein [Candidatus Saccharimonadales bacterium]|nr:AbrB/MazE/SpoVT family DNA-binding domain-containing protein [Candidatus Saccharimonadales bacterium]
MHGDFKFYASATVGVKGQIVLPQEAREELDIKEGDKVVILRAPHEGGLLVLKADKIAEMVNTMSSHLHSVSNSLKQEHSH